MNSYRSKSKGGGYSPPYERTAFSLQPTLLSTPLRGKQPEQNESKSKTLHLKPYTLNPFSHVGWAVPTKLFNRAISLFNKTHGSEFKKSKGLKVEKFNIQI